MRADSVTRSSFTDRLSETAETHRVARGRSNRLNITTLMKSITINSSGAVISSGDGAAAAAASAAAADALTSP